MPAFDDSSMASARLSCALLVIDVQQGLDEPHLGKRNNPDAERNMAMLMQLWRSSGQPVLHVKHNSTEPASSLRPGTSGNALKAGFEPVGVEPLFEKTVNSAFIGTDLEKQLRDMGINDLVVVGLTTDHCISTTVRMAANLGFSVQLVRDATATFDRTSINGRYITAEEMHEVNLSSLNGEFCTIVTSQELASSSPSVSLSDG